MRGNITWCGMLPLLCLCCAVVATPAQSPDSGAPPAAVNAPAAVTSNEPPSISTANHLYRDGKMDEAIAEYNRVIQSGFNSAAGYAGLVRVYLHEDMVAEASAAAAKAIEQGPDMAPAHIALGEVLFRQGKIEEAAGEFRKLVLANTSDGRAYYGMSRVMHVASFHRKEKALLDRAHELTPNDPDILRTWLMTLGLADRIKELQTVLDGNTLGGEERKRVEKQFAHWSGLAARPPHNCRLVTSVTSTQADLQPMMYDAKRADGYGLPVKVNSTLSTLRLDTGASGILITRRIAEKAAIHKVIDTTIGGIGDKGDQPAYLGYADTIKIGDLEFHDCYVEVTEKSVSSSEDGLLGPDVFSQFLVDLDFPNQKLRLSQLPSDPGQPAAPVTLDSRDVIPARFHDRYVAPEMKTFTSVYRFGHNLLLPTKVNDTGPVLFLIDTGSFENIIALDLARQVAEVRAPENYKMRGLSGEVKKVYRADDVKVQFPGFGQKMDTMLCIDMAKISDGTGTEVSGIYGFATLHMLEMKLDYRDGLVEVKFDPKRF